MCVIYNGYLSLALLSSACLYLRLKTFNPCLLNDHQLREYRHVLGAPSNPSHMHYSVSTAPVHKYVTKCIYLHDQRRYRYCIVSLKSFGDLGVSARLGGDSDRTKSFEDRHSASPASSRKEISEFIGEDAGGLCDTNRYLRSLKNSVAAEAEFSYRRNGTNRKIYLPSVSQAVNARLGSSSLTKRARVVTYL